MNKGYGLHAKRARPGLGDRQGRRRACRLRQDCIREPRDGAVREGVEADENGVRVCVVGVFDQLNKGDLAATHEAIAERPKQPDRKSVV